MSARTPPPDPSAKSGYKARIWLVGTQLLAVLAFVVPVFFLIEQMIGTPGPAASTLMEIAGYEPLPARYTFLLLALTLLGLPLTLFSATYAWRLFSLDQYKRASLVSAIPLLYLAFASCLLPYLVMLLLLLRRSF